MFILLAVSAIGYQAYKVRDEGRSSPLQYKLYQASALLRLISSPLRAVSVSVRLSLSLSLSLCTEPCTRPMPCAVLQEA
eukprot:27869-Rhodomonas_salina.1